MHQSLVPIVYYHCQIASVFSTFCLLSMSNCLVSLQQQSRTWSLALTVAFQQATSKPTQITTSKITTNKYKRHSTNVAQ